MARSGSPADDERSGASRFRGLHARTYEMELLVSGAVVFGLLQLPTRVDAGFDRLAAGMTGSLRLLTGAISGYLVMVLYLLVATFLLHLVARTYWIGLLGLESVYEHGVRWDRLKPGPRTVKVYRARMGSLARAVDRTDDICSLVFSFGFFLAAIFIFSIVAILAGALAALATSLFGLTPGAVIAVFWGVVVALFGLQPASAALDRAVGPRLTEGSLPSRLLEWLLRAGYVVSPMRWTAPIALTLESNLPEGRFGVAIMLACSLLGVTYVGVTVGGALLERDRLQLESLRYFPISLESEGVDPVHYRDWHRPGSAAPTAPSIHSHLVEGAYLELVVPYVPRRHNELVEASCTGLAPLRGEGFLAPADPERPPGTVEAASACLGSLFQVRLDGETLADLRWDFTLDPGSGLPAVVTFVPVARLSPGRHELEVVVPGRKASPSDRKPDRHLIPFWL